MVVVVFRCHVWRTDLPLVVVFREVVALPPQWMLQPRRKRSTREHCKHKWPQRRYCDEIKGAHDGLC